MELLPATALQDSAYAAPECACVDSAGNEKVSWDRGRAGISGVSLELNLKV
jgi:hypothetical protein